MTTTDETMMTDHTEMHIPDDVMEAAYEAWAISWDLAKGNKKSDGSAVYEPIARAILAERNRCARIAEENRIRRSGGWV